MGLGSDQKRTMEYRIGIKRQSVIVGVDKRANTGEEKGEKLCELQGRL